MPDRPSEKSRGVATALAVLLGSFGAHRFYVGKTKSGLAMAMTLGGLGIWWLYDLVMVASGEFRDADGCKLSLWDPSVTLHPEDLSTAVLDELDMLRREVAELHERVDFAERLLGQVRTTEPPYLEGRSR